MKLVIFIGSLEAGGAQRVTANLANNWAEKGWDITIVTLYGLDTDFYDLHPLIKRIRLVAPPIAIMEKARKFWRHNRVKAGNLWKKNVKAEWQDKVNVKLQKIEKVSLNTLHTKINIFSGLWYYFGLGLALRKILRQSKPDLAFTMMPQNNLFVAFAAWRLPNLCVVGSERVYPPLYRIGRAWELLRRHFYGLMDAMTAQTVECADWLKAHTNSRSVEVIPNPVGQLSSLNAPQVNPDVFCRPTRKILLAVGRLEPQKQFDLLINCFKSLAVKFPDWDLVILGDGPLRPVLENQVRQAGLESRFFLPGRVGNVDQWYARSDLFVLSSAFEGFPNVLLEAMACGAPVVSFDCETGPRDLIRHEVDGLLVPSGNEAALTASLARLMGDEESRRRYSKKACEVRDRFSMERIVGMWEELFEKSLREKTGKS